MPNELTWSDWYPPIVSPSIGDYVQMKGICLTTGEPQTVEGMVVGFGNDRIKLVPPPETRGIIQRWRKLISGNTTTLETKQKEPINAPT